MIKVRHTLRAVIYRTVNVPRTDPAPAMSHNGVHSIVCGVGGEAEVGAFVVVSGVNAGCVAVGDVVGAVVGDWMGVADPVGDCADGRTVGYGVGVAVGALVVGEFVGDTVEGCADVPHIDDDIANASQMPALATDMTKDPPCQRLFATIK